MMPEPTTTAAPLVSPLFDFRLRYDKDDNEWWRLDPGEAKNLFDATLEHIDALQDRIDSLPEDECPTCGALRCCCAYDWPGAVCGVHYRRPEATDGAEQRRP